MSELKITVNGIRDLLSFGWQLAELDAIKDIDKIFPIKKDFIEYRKGIAGEVVEEIAREFNLSKVDAEVVKRAIEIGLYEEATELLSERLERRLGETLG